MSEKITGEMDLRGRTIAAAVDYHKTRIAVLDTEQAQHDHPKPEVVEADDPKGYYHKVYHREGNPDGTYENDNEAYFRELAHELEPASKILLLGHGTGKSNAADHLLTFLNKHFSEVAAKVVGVQNADIDDLTDNQLLRMGQEHFGLVPERGGWKDNTTG